jgi:ABC-type transport system involved in multi-copper enzyme maturation permease subunit
MTNLLAMEWLKLRKRPLPWAMLVTIVIITTAFFLLTYTASQFANRGEGGQSTRFLLSSLQMPNAIYTFISDSDWLVVMLISVVAAIMTGTEFSLGTVRLLLVRGPGRINLWLSKALLLLIFAAIISVIDVLVGFLLGSIIDAVTGHRSAWSFGETALGALQLIGAATLSFWTYALLALLAATFFRSPIAGIGVALGYRVAELIAGPLLILALRTDGFLHFLGQLNYFLIGNNMDSLLRYAAPTGWVSTPTLFSINDPQALIYMLVAAALFLGLALFNIQSRDVTS